LRRILLAGVDFEGSRGAAERIEGQPLQCTQIVGLADYLQVEFTEKRMAHAQPVQDSANAPRAESFALRHPFVVHGAIVLLGWCAYGFDRVDVVWCFVRSSGNARTLEHAGFGFAALLIGLGIWLGAWPSGNQVNWAADDVRTIRCRSIGEILHAAGIATLLPLAGAIVLILAETTRSLLFAHAKMGEIAARAAVARPAPMSGLGIARRFFIRHIAGICAFVSMLVFSITLRDRLADALFATTAMVFIVTRFLDAP
jgi:hypothetical protein